MNHTPGPWTWHWAQDANGHADGRIHTLSANNYLGMSICVAVSPRFQNEKQWQKDAPLLAAGPEMLAALKAADQFITNGIEFGYIRMPDASTPDSAHATPEIIRNAIAQAEGAVTQDKRADD